MNKVDRLIKLAHTLVTDFPQFFEKLGPGKGDNATHSFMKELRLRAKNHFDGADYWFIPVKLTG